MVTPAISRAFAHSPISRKGVMSRDALMSSEIVNTRCRRPRQTQGNLKMNGRDA